ncbi:Protein ltv1 [Xanthoria calcicola]
MPRKGWIDKNNATTFALVHRPQNDPKIHDASSSSMVFQELAPSQARKIKTRTDLESELFQDTDRIGSQPPVRENEGEAAEYGVYYDDTGYDYMQHLRDLNDQTSKGESYFMEAPVSKKDKDVKGKQKMSLDDALRQTSIGEDTSTAQLLDEDILPSKNLKQTTYQDQQDIPDALAGFQPDMDPRLREALEALEDDAYVDDEEDLFGELAKDGEVSLEEFEDLGFAGDEIAMDDDGWETDDTVKPANEYKTPPIAQAPNNAQGDVTMSDASDHGDGDWMKEFSKFKSAEKTAKAAGPNPKAPDLQSSIVTGSSMTDGRRKKRKGAMTSSTGYSMTSSSLFRTEGQTLQDARFDKVLEDYAEEDMDDDADDGASVMTGSSIRSKPSSVASSQASPSLRNDFDSIMDEFLGGYSMSGKKRVKKGGYQSGLEQLDEVRRELGPARLGRQKA